jgi:hypothetical protein
MARYLGAAGNSYIGRTRTSRHAWVECRDAADPLQRRDVERLHATVADVKASETAAWKPNDTMLVSGTVGFTPDALVEAKLHGIVCYRRSRDGFERVA